MSKMSSAKGITSKSKQSSAKGTGNLPKVSKKSQKTSKSLTPSPTPTPTTSPTPSPPTSPPTSSAKSSSPQKGSPQDSAKDKKQAPSITTESPSFRFKSDQPKRSPESMKGIVKSRKDTDEDFYHFMTPKKTAVEFKQLLICNIVLTIFIVIALASWIGLLYFFLFGYFEKINVPRSKSLTKLCQERSTNQQNCFYSKDKYPNSCDQPQECSTVTLKVDILNESMYGGGDLLVYKFKVDKERVDFTDDLDATPCKANSYCRDRFCEEEVVFKDQLKEYSERKPQNGHWQLNCDAEEIQCYDPQFLITIGKEAKNITTCNPGNCHTLSEYKPTHHVRFGFLSCNYRLPEFGGKPCWGDNDDNISDVVVTVQVCEACLHGGSGGKNNKCDEPKECTVTCTESFKKKLYYLPDHYNCSKADGTKGFCFHGNCAPMTNLTCHSSKDPDHDHHDHGIIF